MLQRVREMRSGSDKGTIMLDLFTVFTNRQFQNIAVCHFNTTLSTSLIMPVLPVFLAGKGFAETEIGMIMGAAAGAALFVRPWIGIQVDTRGSRPVLLSGQVLLFLSIMGLIWAEHIASFIGLRLVYGIAIALYGTGAVTFASSIGTGKTNSNAIALYTLMTMFGLGASMSLAQFFFDSYGFTVIVFIASVSIALAFCVMKFRAHSFALSGKKDGTVPFMEVLRIREVIATSVGQFGASFAFGALFTFIPLASIQNGISFYSFFFIAFAVTVIFSRFFVQRIIDQFGLERTCVYSYGGMVLGVLLPAFPLSPLVLISAGLCYGVGLGIIFPAFVILLVQRTGASSRGTSLGILIAAGDIAMALSVTILGGVAEHFGYVYLFGATTTILAACMITLYSLIILGGKRDAGAAA